MNKAIEILISPEGHLSIEAVGFSGPDCEKATQFLEQALGNIQNRNRKPEYLRQASVQKQQRIRKV